MTNLYWTLPFQSRAEHPGVMKQYNVLAISVSRSGRLALAVRIRASSAALRSQVLAYQGFLCTPASYEWGTVMDQ